MNKTLCFFLVLCFSVQFSNAQNIDWLSQHPASSSSDYYLAITHDDNGNAYSTGNEDHKYSQSNCGGKIVVSKFNSSGALQYSNPYQPSNNSICDDKGFTILHHAGSGKLIVGGYENHRAFLGYFNAGSGAFINKVTISTTGDYSGIKGLHFSGNHILAVGYFQKDISFGGSSPISLTGSSQYNVFIAKFDLSGNVLQAIEATPVSGANAWGFDIAEDAGGNVYISVAASNDLVFNGTSTYNIFGSGYKIVVFKLNAAFGLVSGTQVGATSSSIGIEYEFPVHLDWSASHLLVGGIHNNQSQSFLAKLDLSTSTPGIVYNQNLSNRVIRDIATDCNYVYLTGEKGWGSRRSIGRRAGPCVNSSFLFLDKHDITTGVQLSSKQASGCTFGEGIATDRKDNIWLNGTFGDPNSMTFESQSQSFSAGGKNGLVSKLTADKTCTPKPYACCKGTNLVANGNFDSGNTGFTNTYSYQSTVAPGSIAPGQYGIVNGAQAASINPSWTPVQDPSTCSNAWGDFLLVNGLTGIGAQIAWEQTFTVDDWNGYKFCFKSKSLNNSATSVTPKLEIQFSMPFGNSTETINLTAGPCDWQTFSRNLDLWGYGNSLTIRIILYQNVSGTGNDVAIDNISLMKLNRCPAASAVFDLKTTTPHPNNPTHFSVTATADIVAPCTSVWWEVCKYDIATGDCISTTKLNGIWWNTVTDFPGYNGTSSQSGTNPGLFEYGYFYRITRGTWGDCNSWVSSAKYIGAPSARARLQTYSERQFKNNEKRILRKFRTSNQSLGKN